MLLKSVLAIVLFLLSVAVLLFAFTQWKASELARRYPNLGERIDVGGGVMLNSVHVSRPDGADLPPLVFIHGASGNLRDPMEAFRAALEGRAEMLFVDRPGHGYSDRGGPGSMTPDGQADLIARLMEKRGISSAIIIAHSFGGSTAATFALRHKGKTHGLVFLAAATHPWPGGVDWYYDVANTPVLGWLFCNTLALPAGLLQMEHGVQHVFQPNPVPEGYSDKAAIPLVLRPDNFCNNARDVANLQAYVERIQPSYSEIAAPAIIITGDSDDIVYEEIHSRGLKRDIPNSELYWVKNLGHKPDYIATDLAIAAIEKIAGLPRDLETMARQLEDRIKPRSL